MYWRLQKMEIKIIWFLSPQKKSPKVLTSPRPPRATPRPRTTPVGAAPLTPFPMSLSTAALFTDMEKFLCRERPRNVRNVSSHLRLEAPLGKISLERANIYSGQIIRKVVCVCVCVEADLLLLSERHQCQGLHGLILQNSSKFLILHVLWDLGRKTGTSGGQNHSSRLKTVSK